MERQKQLQKPASEITTDRKTWAKGDFCWGF